MTDGHRITDTGQIFRDGVLWLISIVIGQVTLVQGSPRRRASCSRASRVFHLSFLPHVREHDGISAPVNLLISTSARDLATKRSPAWSPAHTGKCVNLKVSAISRPKRTD